MELPPFEKKQSGVYQAVEPVPRITAENVRSLVAVAAALPRKRARICTHRSGDTPIHEMIIALGRETYVQPHAHVNKSESFHVIEGRCDLVLFDDAGGIAEVIRLGEANSGQPFFHRIASPVFHTLVIRTPFFVIHETTNGPFIPEETIFAKWAPAESDTAASTEYAAALLRKVDAFVAKG